MRAESDFHYYGYVTVQVYPFGSSCLSCSRARQEGDTLVVIRNGDGLESYRFGPHAWFEAVEYTGFGAERARFTNRRELTRNDVRPPQRGVA